MTDFAQYLPQIAGGGTLAVAGYAFKLLTDFISQKRQGVLEEKKLDLAEGTQQITDAAAANAILLASLRDSREDGIAKDARIERLEARNAEKDAKIEELQSVVRELRTQLHVALKRLDGVDFELDDLRDK